MLVRGKIAHWFVKPDSDPTWNEEDWERAATYEARLQAKGVSETDRKFLIPCIVWSKKFPGMTFSNDIMKRIQDVSL
jgi:hypothetical protein